MSKKKIAHINATINATPGLITVGSTITESQFCALVDMNYINPVTFSGMNFHNQYIYVKLKTNYLVVLNRVLALRGLQCKSHNYCTSFTVTASLDYAKSRNRTRSTNCGIRNGNMLAGIATHRGTWTALTKAEGTNLYHGYARRGKA